MLQVLEGYVYLGNTATLGEEVMNAFANVVNTAAHRVIRGVILTRQGLESKARSTSMVQELVKLLPPDLFRTCLARVRFLKHLSSPLNGDAAASVRTCPQDLCPRDN